MPNHIMLRASTFVDFGVPFLVGTIFLLVLQDLAEAQSRQAHKHQAVCCVLALYMCVGMELSQSSEWNASLAQEAAQLLASMEKSGMEVDIVAYNTVISACARAGEFEKVWDLFEQADGKGLEPDVHTYSALMLTYAKGAHGQSSQRVSNGQLPILGPKGCQNARMDCQFVFVVVVVVVVVV
eukprot:5459587-Amphidinium_carterae.2